MQEEPTLRQGKLYDGLVFYNKIGQSSCTDRQLKTSPSRGLSSRIKSISCHHDKGGFQRGKLIFQVNKKEEEENEKKRKENRKVKKKKERGKKGEKEKIEAKEKKWKAKGVFF